jgi:hypothetical protein
MCARNDNDSTVSSDSTGVTRRRGRYCQGLAGRGWGAYSLGDRTGMDGRGATCVLSLAVDSRGLPRGDHCIRTRSRLPESRSLFADSLLHGTCGPARHVSSAGMAKTRRGPGSLRRDEAIRRVFGYQKLVIQVRASNLPAQGFYKRLGFVECGRLRAQVIVEGTQDDEILMELFLNE